MVQSTLLRTPSLIAPPSSIWELPLQCGVGGGVLSIHHKSGAHCGRIAVHWAVESRVPSRLLSVRGGVQLHRHHTSWHKGTERDRKKRGAEHSKKRGERPHLKWNVIRVRRKGGRWRKKEEDDAKSSKRVQVDSLFCCFSSLFIHFPHVSLMCLLFACKFIIIRVMGGGFLFFCLWHLCGCSRSL